MFVTVVGHSSMTDSRRYVKFLFLEEKLTIILSLNLFPSENFPLIYTQNLRYDFITSFFERYCKIYLYCI